MEHDKPQSLEEYVPGVANGHHYMAKLSYFADGPWSIEVVHVEGLPPLGDSGKSWPSREEAVQAANAMVAALAH
ncbi:hypothetical protein [Rhodoferax sp. WC2427]|uniref:hypothetical protein n=1 Tax=Rhodoferax sp. WC2427 TaxID=3234144 RepID=UPI00346665E8